MSTVNEELDPWADPNDFGGIDLTRDKIDLVDDQQMIPPDLDPLVVTNVPAAEPEPTPAPLPEPEPEIEEPQVITNPDGSSIRIEKSTKGWKGTVDIGYGSTQVFYGKTKNELLSNLMIAQLNATKKIRDQNKKLKLGVVEELPVATVVQTERALGRKLTADESFELKTMLESDPDKAFDTWFQKRTGSSVDQLVAKAEKGQRASNELSMEQANREFLAANPEYYGDEKYENFNSLISYLVKHKLRRGRKAGDEQQVLEDLASNGLYTASNLEEAFTELSEAGLLLSAPRTPEKHVAPAPPAAPERIVRTETRPRAGLGITSREVTPTRTAEPTPPSVEDFNMLTDEQLNARIEAERKKAIASRR